MKHLRRLLPYTLLVVALLACGTIVVRAEQIGDWFRLRDYQPQASIAQLARDATMTPHARHMFYVNHPSLEDKKNFNKHCTNETEQSVVLGCYHGDRQGIYLYDITDPRLEGVEEVTAAHEMLHQAYDRLNAKERQHIDKLLVGFYDHGLQDQLVKDQIATYRKSEPNALPNEMHSLFATEVADLPSELETYFKQYFTDRAKVVALNSTYQDEFARRKAQVADYDAKLAALKKQIGQNEAQLQTRLRDINRKKAELDRQRAAEDIDAYNTGVPIYNSMIDSYNRLVNATRRMIDEYNQIADQRNAIAVQERELRQALDSRLAPVDN